MRVFYNSYVNYEGQALKQMRKWLGMQPPPCFTLSWIMARSREIEVNPQRGVAIVR